MRLPLQQFFQDYCAWLRACDEAFATQFPRLAILCQWTNHVAFVLLCTLVLIVGLWGAAWAGAPSGWTQRLLAHAAGVGIYTPGSVALQWIEPKPHPLFQPGWQPDGTFSARAWAEAMEAQQIAVDDYVAFRDALASQSRILQVRADRNQRERLEATQNAMWASRFDPGSVHGRRSTPLPPAAAPGQRRQDALALFSFLAGAERGFGVADQPTYSLE